MTDQTPDLAALEALASKATPGPWSVGRHRDGHAVAIDDADGYSDVVGPGPVDCMAYCYGGVSTIEWTDATAAYVAAADPQTVLWLIREVKRLTRWKSEALPVMDGLQELGTALGLPLGERITGPAAVAAAERLTARAEKAEATIERVRATVALMNPASRLVKEIHAALDGGESDA